MRQVSNIVNTALTMSIKPQIKPVSEDAKNFIDGLFDQLKAMFPAWKNAWATQDEFNKAKQTWVMAFSENEITSKQVKIGIKACRASRSDFIPSVGKFISLCKPSPESLNIPTHELAFEQALKGGLMHPVVDAAARATGTFELRRGELSNKALKERFFYYYDIMMNRYANNEKLSMPVNAAICNGTEKEITVEIVEDIANLEVKQRIKKQGISTNANEARLQCLAMLGIKKKEKSA